MKVKRNFSYFFLFILILVVYVKIESVKCEMEPAIFRELTDLSMFQDNDLWRIRVDDTDRDLVITGPDVWQGNSDIFHTEGSVRVGHLWSQFLMLREGYWLTDRAESEGEYLIDFNVIQDRGKIIWYNGSWGFFRPEPKSRFPDAPLLYSFSPLSRQLSDHRLLLSFG